ncbi:MAG: 23S rRNA (guanosine(2251)-2'-O)-methyltransferase RlmB [Acidobacteriota bacterium]
MEVLYGIHPVVECLRAGRRKVHRLLVADDRRERDLVQKLGGALPVQVDRTSRRDLDREAGTRDHQGVAARVDPYPYVDWEELLEDGCAFLLLLDNVTDPHNTGAIMRSAYCAGATGVVIRKHHASPVTAAAAKASAGAVEHLRVARVPNPSMFLEAAGQAGMQRAGLDMQGERLWTAGLEWEKPLVLLVGAEGRGLGPLVKRHCDLLLSIPMQGGLDSLNASVASALALFEVSRRRAGF